MSVNTELKRAAEAVIAMNYPWEHTVRDGRLGKTSTEYASLAHPSSVLALIAENERLTNNRDMWRGQCDRQSEMLRLAHEVETQLKAENAGLKTGYQAYEQVNAELKAENEALRDGANFRAIQSLRQDCEALRKALGECADSLHGEMLQKFGGQLLDDMHPVTRRDYDRDMAELARYRAAMGKGEQS
ncbi:hypothetical protein YA0783_23055 [Pseudomonas corrugata]|uniref:hypothetical protein n=1 Tax=Pseudomonas corrugata TaxID=47879 RepID=UPI0018E65FFA|nr:hypothetical protein [Pseudomonas corrugata]MBI6621180.1 hypothetical protein [Pseudomonas corrugata]MBI6693746.1 hypothetical protein [Pseudomonas corrugata]